MPLHVITKMLLHGIIIILLCGITKRPLHVIKNALNDITKCRCMALQKCRCMALQKCRCMALHLQSKQNCQYFLWPILATNAF